MSPNRVRFAAWAAPIVCFGLAMAAAVARHSEFMASERRAQRIDLELSQASVEADALDKLRKDPRFACAQPNPHEESVFFVGLRRHAALANVSIVRLRSQPTVIGDDGAQTTPPTGGASTAAMTKGIRKVSCQLVLDGSYAAQRHFLRGLWKADRLYTVGEVTWSRAKGGTELAFTLTRYVSPDKASKEATNS